ncbi:hypothetical protein EJV44_15395 [Ancylobacter aquaticus]|nr:hypothetical protein EJV44_15395 [Ancylobacter aquaticus]
MSPLSRQDALKSGVSTYFTGLPCKSGHTTRRYTKSGHCVACQQANARLRYSRAGVAEAQRWRQLERNYGVSRPQFEAAMLSQGGECAVCRVPMDGAHPAPSSPVVDHDHTTGKFRGLLCGHCNKALGLFKDNTDTLLRAVKYLERNKAETY